MEMQTITVTREDGTEALYPVHTSVSQVLGSRHDSSGLPYIGALVNNDVCSLAYPLQNNARVVPLSGASRAGARIYRRSLTMLLAKAVRDLYTDCRFSVRHSLGNGYYCEVQRCGGLHLNEDDIAKLAEHVETLVQADTPFTRERVGYEEAYRRLEAQNQPDKLALLKYRNPPQVTIFRCGDYADLGLGVIAPSAGTLPPFRLIHYPPGLVLQFPEWNGDGWELSPFEKQPHLFQIFREHARWGKIIGIQTVGDLNEAVVNRRLHDVIKMAEARHEKDLSRIAAGIAENPGQNRWILIAGPSSAGKTTFSKRLAVHLRVNGLRPVRMEIDNYFVNRTDTPLTKDGDHDFEHINAIDLGLLNQHLERLQRGETIEMPRFNFKEGCREYHGDTLRLEEDQVVIMEGIHCLNPLLSPGVPDASKFRIYISAITQLTLDNNNRISTTDIRLLRRMIRDHQHRGHDALRTLAMWPNVRRGEKAWIFPHQRNAHMVFNSSLDYELAVLKAEAQPLLIEVKPFHEQYGEARRLQHFLELVNTASEELVPSDSLLREFIGGSIFAKDD